MTRRTGVIQLTERAASVQVTTPKAATKGQPCEHPLGCPTPWTTWTAAGGRCEDHKTLTKHEIKRILAVPREAWVRGGSYSIAARTRRRDTGADQPHPYTRDPGANRGICGVDGCGLGIRAAIHRAEAAGRDRDVD